MNDTYDYGLWSMVILNSAIVIFFAFSFVKPKSSTDWRSLGVFSAFIVGPVYRNVWLPTDYLFLVRMAC